MGQTWIRNGLQQRDGFRFPAAHRAWGKRPLAQIALGRPQGLRDEKWKKSAAYLNIRHEYRTFGYHGVAN